MDSDGYDLNAKAAGNASNEYPMLQNLLADRFHLVLRRQTRELPVFFLSVAKSGLKLPPSRSALCFDGDPPPPGKTIVPPCGNVLMSLAPLGLRIRGGETSMDPLAAILSGVLGRTLKTGYQGAFDVEGPPAN
jgi:uncharacterized protein (TIGR03435 family)